MPFSRPSSSMTPHYQRFLEEEYILHSYHDEKLQELEDDKKLYQRTTVGLAVALALALLYNGSRSECSSIQTLKPPTTINAGDGVTGEIFEVPVLPTEEEPTKVEESTEEEKSTEEEESTEEEKSGGTNPPPPVDCTITGDCGKPPEPPPCTETMEEGCGDPPEPPPGPEDECVIMGVCKVDPFIPPDTESTDPDVTAENDNEVVQPDNGDQFIDTPLALGRVIKNNGNTKPQEENKSEN